MLMLDQIPDQALTGFCVELIAGIADSCAIRNQFLRIGNAQRSKLWCGLAIR
jgi:hypothetical protein